MLPINISAVIVTRNESDKLEGCLNSIRGFADEVILFDLESTDDIQGVAKKYQAKIINHKKVPFVEQVREQAIGEAKGKWVLVLDPDERLTEKLKQLLLELVKQNKYSAVNIPRKNIFFKKWIAHSNWWPDRHIRFFKKGTILWPSKIHTYPQVLNGDVIQLAARDDVSIQHFGYDSYIQFIYRQQRYALIESSARYERGERFSVFKLVWLPLREFLARYIKHSGFLDGLNGIFLVFTMMYFWVLVEYGLLKLQLKNK